MTRSISFSICLSAYSLPYFDSDTLYKTKPNIIQRPTIAHSYGQISADGIPGIYRTATPIDMTMAIQPIIVPPVSLNGRFISGFFLRKMMNEMATISHATTSPSPPAFTNHSRAGRPNNGAAVDKTAINRIALWGVLYFGCRSPNDFGSMPALARAYIARLPPT